MTSAERFWRYTTENGRCVVWTGCTDRKGYGRVHWDGRNAKAHRVAFFLRMGRWPDGLLRHLCNEPTCVLHVVEGTASENVRDSIAAGTNFNARKMVCKNGHEFTPENTYRHNGKRHCKTCQRIVDAARTRRKAS